MDLEQNLEYLAGVQLPRLFLVYLPLALAELPSQLLIRHSGQISHCAASFVRGTASHCPSAGSVASNALAPFQRICTPMQTSRNDDRRMITPMAVAPSARANLSENP